MAYHDIVAKEALQEAVPEVLLLESCEPLGTDDLSVDRYVSSDFHHLEVERMWRHVWQMACRDEDIPEVGDQTIYDIADQSFILVRVAPAEVKAYYNACLHRGTQLCDSDGHRLPYLRCPYHGWSWNLDGTLRSIPSKWDFAHVDPKALCLPEARVGHWGGFVFLTMDPDAPPLDAYLGVLPDHFASAGWDLGKLVKVAHVAVIAQCNWKVAQDGFVESYHASATHPQLAYTISDEGHQYDYWGPNVSRLLGTVGLPYSAVRREVDQQTIAASLAELGLGDPASMRVPDGSTARAVAADALRDRLAAMSGRDFTGVSTTEVLDAIHYSLFPNLVVYGGFSFPLAYRFRPNGNDPHSSICEFMVFAAPPPGVHLPVARMRWIDSGDLTDAVELGPLALPFNQDLAVLARVQRGLRAAAKRGVTLSNYQESRIRHYHTTLDRYLNDWTATGGTA